MPYFWIHFLRYENIKKIFIYNMVVHSSRSACYLIMPYL